MEKTRRIYFVSYGIGEWRLTDDVRDAKDPENHYYRLANLDDLDEWGAVGGCFTEGVIEIEEGFFRWNPTMDIEADLWGNSEYNGDYEMVY